MHISIKTVKGKSINLDVEDSSNTIDLKFHGEPIRDLVLQLGHGLGPGRLDKNQSKEAKSGVEFIRIYVKITLTGRTSCLEVDRFDTIGEVKANYEKFEGIPVDQQRMVFQGKTLDNNRTVDEYNIENDSTLVVFLRQCGC